MILGIWDNGRGFDPAKTQNEGLGLGIMQERAESIQADLDVESQPGQGTRISLQWKARSEDI